jgi:hypothetical protein
MINMLDHIFEKSPLSQFRKKGVPDAAEVLLEQMREAIEQERQEQGLETFSGGGMVNASFDTGPTEAASSWPELEISTAEGDDPFVVGTSYLTAVRDHLASGKPMTAKGSGFLNRPMSDLERAEAIAKNSEAIASLEAKRAQVDVARGKELDRFLGVLHEAASATLSEQDREALFLEFQRRLDDGKKNG